LNAGRKYLGLDSLAGTVFLTSGLGGMSGAQAKVNINVILTQMILKKKYFLKHP
jgi:urocanate hydratase